MAATFINTVSFVFLPCLFFQFAVYGLCQGLDSANNASTEVSEICNKEQDCHVCNNTVTNSTCLHCQYPNIQCTNIPGNKTCLLHRDYICNSTVTCLGLTPCDVGCPTHYRCRNSDKCVLRTTVCNDVPCDGCPDDHEWENGVGFQCFKNGKSCRLPQQLIWDSVQDCDDGSDLCYAQTATNFVDGRDIRTFPGVVFLNQWCTQCLDGSMIIPRSKVCDGVVDCPDLSDECLCENQVADICNHVTLRTDRASACSTGQVYCENGNFTKCVNRSSVCDGIPDCANNLDEKFSYCGGTLPCQSGLPSDANTTCRCKQANCLKQGVKSTPLTGVLCDRIEDCVPSGSFGVIKWVHPPGFPADECRAQCSNGTGAFNCTVDSLKAVSIAPHTIPCRKHLVLGNVTVNITLKLSNKYECDGKVDCTVDNRDESNCPDRFYCPNGNLVSIPLHKKCDGYMDCDNGTDESRENCPERFYCPSRQGSKISVSKAVVCDFNHNCDNFEDETNCTEDGRFYCESGSPFFIRNSQILDGRGDCSDWSDECSETLYSDPNILSSRYELIAKPSLRAIVWIMAILAFIGNLTVIIGESRALKKVFDEERGASLRTNHMLVLNLAVADFLMSIYLFMLGIAGAVYSGSYCSRSLEWLSSKSCVAMGVLVVLSSETSVLTMLFLTISRLYAVSKPFAALSKPGFRFTLALVGSIWAISITIALVPLATNLQSTFVDQALIKTNPFFSNVVVSFDAAKNFTIKLLTYSQQLSHQSDSLVQKVSDITTWNGLQEFFSAHPSLENNLQIIKLLGYYSANSVCIPNLFVTRADGPWRFSLAISILNFLTFIYVAITYVAIIFKVKASARKTGKGDKVSDNIQRKVVRLILTDFCCWIPLSIMVFIHFNGVQIDNISYSIAAIILLPINSALNPILYSNVIDKLFVKCKGSAEPWFSKSLKSDRVSNTN